MADFNAKAYLCEKLNERRSLDDFRVLMAYLQNPQDDYRIIHVAGTNGKGSTSAFMADILTNNGYRTGLFTSPALLQVNERMQMNRDCISNEELEAIALDVSRAEQKSGIRFSGFHRMTAVAWLWFSRRKIDFAVIEAGIGGTMDCTNICDSEIALITAIGMDHVSLLGESLPEVAAQKAGIIKRGQRCVVVQPQTDEVMNVISQRCKEMRVPMRRVADCERCVDHIEDYVQYCRIRFPDGMNLYQTIQMMGEHQLTNACTALVAARELGLDMIRSSEAVEDTIWPGRMELLDGEPPVLLDGAHNPQAMAALIKGVKQYFPNHFIILITSMMEDKDSAEMVAQLSELIDYAIAVPLNERSMDPEILMKWFRAKNIPTMYSKSFPNGFVDALRITDAHPDRAPLVLVTGSLYLVGEFRGFLLGPNDDDE